MDALWPTDAPQSWIRRVNIPVPLRYIPSTTICERGRCATVAAAVAVAAAGAAAGLLPAAAAVTVCTARQARTSADQFSSATLRSVTLAIATAESSHHRRQRNIVLVRHFHFNCCVLFLYSNTRPHTYK
jgi:hypothetical protein